MGTPDVDRDRLGQLLADTAAGDRGAFEAVYQRTCAKLFGICLRILNDRSEAEEVLQDVYLVVWRKAGLFDASRASPITWLAMIARNKAIDRLRVGRIDRAAVPLDFSAELVADGVTAETLAEAGLEQRRLQGCMDELSSEQRNVIRVAFFEGCTYEEIASRSDTPVGTVKSWIRRGLLKLKACLQR